MRILVLGGDGMLGHHLFRVLGEEHEVCVTLRLPLENYCAFELFDASSAIGGIDVRSMSGPAAACACFRPDVVVNAVGLIKQRHDAPDVIANIEINALFPHRLAELCRTIGARLVHVSTDCVFAGTKGGYTEEDLADAPDLYGRTKHLGEIAGYPGCLTLRTSIVGRELSRKRSLVEWFLAQTGSVRGYTRAVFSGLPAATLAKIIGTIIERHRDAEGLYHVGAAPIDKFTFLQLLRAELKKNIEIVPDDEFAVDRSLDSTRFRSQFGYTPPEWPQLIKEI